MFITLWFSGKHLIKSQRFPLGRNEANTSESHKHAHRLGFTFINISKGVYLSKASYDNCFIRNYMVVCMQSKYTLASQLSECVLFLMTLENNIKEFFWNFFDEMKICGILFTDKSQADSVRSISLLYCH